MGSIHSASRLGVVYPIKLQAHQGHVSHKREVLGDEARQLGEAAHRLTVNHESELDIDPAALQVHDAANGLVMQ